MASLAKQIVMCHTPKNSNHHHHHHREKMSKEEMHSISPQPHIQNKQPTRRHSIISTLLASSAAVGVLQSAAAPPWASAQSWGGRSFLWERYFEPALSPEDAAARIRQTAEGMRSLREMLDTMCWKYVMAYIRLKQAYLESDLKNAFATLPPARRSTYIKTANELVDNMAELDIHVRTPKIYESHLYYEKTLKSLDDLVALLA